MVVAAAGWAEERLRLDPGLGGGVAGSHSAQPSAGCQYRCSLAPRHALMIIIRARKQTGSLQTSPRTSAIILSDAEITGRKNSAPVWLISHLRLFSCIQFYGKHRHEYSTKTCIVDHSLFSFLFAFAWSCKTNLPESLKPPFLTVFVTNSVKTLHTLK